MPIRILSSVWPYGLTLAAIGLLAGVGLPAPVPKSPPKVPDNETAVPATDDKTKMAANEKASIGNLKKLALSFHNFADKSNGSLPIDSFDRDGKKLLSWRVHLLPLLGAEKLHSQFRLGEPWDSADNLKLLPLMPKVFVSPRVVLKNPGFTVYQGFAGPSALFESGRPGLFPASITDGTSQTIMLAEASTAVPWTKPADIPFDGEKALPDFGKAYGGRPLVAMCDGSVRVVNTKKVSETTLKAAITINGGEVLGADWDEEGK